MTKHMAKRMNHDRTYTLKTAGSFISFHIPSTPLETKSLTKLAHQVRVLSQVKSGKTQSPGHTSPGFKVHEGSFIDKFIKMTKGTYLSHEMYQ